jgi:endogenous inhibitor of DNA gyrase (YacG/DUF329 family)
MRQPVCVLCRRHPIDPAWRPFCSERCRLQDLAGWIDGSYRVAAEVTDDPDGRENIELESEKD